jgi:hypothetical protein
VLCRVALLALCLLSFQPPLAGTAVVDRFEGDHAVLVFDDGHERVVALDRLPPPARTPDAVVWAVTVGERLHYADFRPAATRRRAIHEQARFDRLAERANRSARHRDRPRSLAREDRPAVFHTLVSAREGI